MPVIIITFQSACKGSVLLGSFSSTSAKLHSGFAAPLCHGAACEASQASVALAKTEPHQILECQRHPACREPRYAGLRTGRRTSEVPFQTQMLMTHANALEAAKRGSAQTAKAFGGHPEPAAFDRSRIPLRLEDYKALILVSSSSCILLSQPYVGLAVRRTQLCDGLGNWKPLSS